MNNKRHILKVEFLENVTYQYNLTLFFGISLVFLPPLLCVKRAKFPVTALARKGLEAKGEIWNIDCFMLTQS